MSDGWSQEELLASVEAYVEMQQKERQGVAFVKKHYYRSLAARFGRSDKAFEYRMQNISYVLALMGREWLTGLKPAKNVGANIAAEIELMLAAAQGKQFSPVAAFEIEVREEARKKYFTAPPGSLHPATITTPVTLFHRDPSVKAWVLEQAKGRCELCDQAAPFNGPDGQPYLEVHHVRRLADNGSDTVTNTVALCPNCHREAHYSENARALVMRLYARIGRLVSEPPDFQLTQRNGHLTP